MRRVRIDVLTPPADSEAAALCVTLRLHPLAELRAADLPAWWRDAISERDDDGEPAQRAVYVACLLVLAAAFVAGFARVEFDDDLVATIIAAATLGLALEMLVDNAAVIRAYSGDGLGSILAAFVAQNAVPV